MLKLKAVFISLFCVFVLTSSGYAIYKAVGGPRLPWLGALLTTLPAALLFVRLYTLGRVARTSRRLPWFIVLGAVGVAISAGSYFAGSGDSGALLLSVAGLLSVVIYSYWYSELPRPANSELRIGSPLPEFELETEGGKPVSSRSFLGKPLLLLFYRGNWCPLCTAQIREVAEQYRELDARGIQVVLASPQPHKYTRSIAAKHEVPFHFLVDTDHKASKRLGVFAKDGLPAGLQVFGYSSDTVWPTVVMTDARGTILFADLTDNYRVRPEPDVFLKVFEGQLPTTASAA